MVLCNIRYSKLTRANNHTFITCRFLIQHPNMHLAPGQPPFVFTNGIRQAHTRHAYKSFTSRGSEWEGVSALLT